MICSLARFLHLCLLAWMSDPATYHNNKKPAHIQSLPKPRGWFRPGYVPARLNQNIRVSRHRTEHVVPHRPTPRPHADECVLPLVYSIFTENTKGKQWYFLRKYAVQENTCLRKGHIPLATGRRRGGLIKAQKDEKTNTGRGTKQRRKQCRERIESCFCLALLVMG